MRTLCIISFGKFCLLWLCNFVVKMKRNSNLLWVHSGGGLDRAMTSETRQGLLQSIYGYLMETNIYSKFTHNSHASWSKREATCNLLHPMKSTNAPQSHSNPSLKKILPRSAARITNLSGCRFNDLATSFMLYCTDNSSPFLVSFIRWEENSKGGSKIANSGVCARTPWQPYCRM